MIFIVLTLSILFPLVISSDEDERDEFSRIKKYELTHFNFDLFASSNIISFDAYNQHYELQLIVNTDLVPSDINHINGNLAIKDGLDQFYSHLNESCHYLGKVLNSNTFSRVAISICNKRGIRGIITAFGDTLSIKPSKYYLDPSYNGDGYHDIKEEHLLFKLSDYDSPRLSMPSQPLSMYNVGIYDDVVYSKGKRRLATAYNGGTNLLEVYSMADPALCDYYKGKSSSIWYDMMVADLSDVWNAVSAEYKYPVKCKCPSWSNDCKTESSRSCTREAFSSKLYGITFKWREFEVVTSYSGVYKSLKPNTFYTDDGLKSLDEHDYLRKFQDWLYRYYTSTKTAKFDQATIFHFGEMGKKGWVHGLAPKGAICKGRGQSSALARYLDDLSFTVKTVAHEIGHNFGMDHDGVNPNTRCDASSGIQGYGSAQTGFSQCSYDEINKYFADNNGLTCLGDRLTKRLVRLDPPSESQGRSFEYVGCSHTHTHLCLYYDEYKEFVVSDLCSYDKPVYKHIADDITYYLMYDEYYKYVDDANKTGEWIISNGIDNGNRDAFCDETDLRECIDGNWKVRIQTDDDDIIKYVYDENMVVLDGECESSKKDKTNVVVLSALGVVILITFGVFMFYRSKQRKKGIEIHDEEIEIEREIEDDEETHTMQI